MAHTAGEWKVVAEEHDELAVAIEFEASDTGYLYIATIHEVGYPDSKETLPNAYLIAAAPELLAACQAVLHDTSLTRIGKLARAAVEKAAGPAGLIQQ